MGGGSGSLYTSNLSLFIQINSRHCHYIDYMSILSLRKSATFWKTNAGFRSNNNSR